MSYKLENKVAIVTGAGRDIGKTAAIKLAEAGADVVVNYHSSKEGAEDTVRQIKENGRDAIAVQADVTDADDVEKLVDRTLSEFGDEIHVLVNNAGGLKGRHEIEEMEEEFWDDVVELNFKSVFLVTRATTPHMPEGSSIVNMSSLAARNGGGSGAIAYASSKAGVMTFTRGLAKELGPRVRVNCVSPGMIDTTFHDTFTPDEARKNVEESVPRRRQGTTEDVANAILFLATDASDYITGESVEINGGMYFI